MVQRAAITPRTPIWNVANFLTAIDQLLGPKAGTTQEGSGLHPQEIDAATDAHPRSKQERTKHKGNRIRKKERGQERDRIKKMRRKSEQSATPSGKQQTGKE